MLNFIYVNPAVINPKTKENVREQEIQKLTSLKEEGYTLIGLEMTVKELSALCDTNIDPQHSDKKTEQSCVKEICQNQEQILSPYKDKKVMFLTNRVDLDSMSSYIVADNYLKGTPLSYNNFIKQINAHDTFQGKAWTGPKDIEEAFNPNNTTKALASTIKVFSITPKNIDDVSKFISTGEVDKDIMENYRSTQQNIINKVKSNEIKVDVIGGIAYVETTLPCATDVGYSKAPVVVAVNPAMKLGPAGEPFRKVSICQHEPGYVDLEKTAQELNSIEQGWGGSPTFKGSKQGENCTIPLSDIKKIVYKNLTPDYKKEVAKNNTKLTDLTLE